MILRVNPNPVISGELPPRRGGRFGLPIGLGHDIQGMWQDNREWGREYWWENWAELGYYETRCTEDCGGETTESGPAGPRAYDDPHGEWRFNPLTDVHGPR